MNQSHVIPAPVGATDTISVRTAANLDEACTEDLLNLYSRMWTECGHKASLLFQMINAHGALGAVKKLINAPSPSKGFVAMLFRGRLDLTVEAIAIAAHWNQLLTADEMERAYQRLDECGYRTGHKMAEAA